VGRSDLSDLEAKFFENMRNLGLYETVRLLSMPNHDAVEQLRREAAQVRFLFIDGDHLGKAYSETWICSFLF
jgi:hypothetical protein